MSVEDFNSYWDMISKIEAQEMLKLLKVQDWSYQKMPEREKMHRDLSKIAYPEKNKSMTLDEYIAKSGGPSGG